MNLLRRLRRKGNFQSHEIWLVTSVLVRHMGRFATRTYLKRDSKDTCPKWDIGRFMYCSFKEKTLKFIAHKAIIIIEIRNGTDASW